MKKIIFILLVLISNSIKAQDNCNVFLWAGDSCRYKACIFLEKMPNYFQLTKQYHAYKDKALEICPDYAVIYKHKSTAYLKTGDFINWMKLMNKAVALNPKENLDYRGWCRFQFFRDYQGAIDDIEALEKMVDYDIGMCQNGKYHLNIAKALCYKMLGKKQKAIQIIENQISKDKEFVGLYDYLHLGVLYLEEKQYDKALIALEKQEEINNLADNVYYKALIYKATGKEYLQLMHLAKEKYINQEYLYDVYTHQVDKVFLSDIEKYL